MFYTITGCVNIDVYGNECKKHCTDHCPEPSCNISNGACFSCTPGSIGDFCEKSKKLSKLNKAMVFEVCVRVLDFCMCD